jgi:hypothetical protein
MLNQTARKWTLHNSERTLPQQLVNNMVEMEGWQCGAICRTVSILEAVGTNAIVFRLEKRVAALVDADMAANRFAINRVSFNKAVSEEWAHVHQKAKMLQHKAKQAWRDQKEEKTDNQTHKRQPDKTNRHSIRT